MTKTALALSPHLDDAVFSCGGTLALLARAGWRVVVATLFTRTVANSQDFALACQLDKGLGPEVDYMALRRAEDVRAVHALGLDAPIHVMLPEAPHRGYGSAAALFGSLSPLDDVSGPLGDAIEELIAGNAPDLVFAPQAIGGHVDHVQVFEACASVTLPMLWWRDFPYAARSGTPAEPFGDQMDGLPEVFVSLDPHAQAAKLAGCLAYASQLGFQFGGPAALEARLSATGAIEILRGDPGDAALFLSA